MATGTDDWVCILNDDWRWVYIERQARDVTNTPFAEKQTPSSPLLKKESLICFI